MKWKTTTGPSAQLIKMGEGGEFSLALRGRCIMPSGRISSHPCGDPPFEALAAIYVPHEECGGAGGNFRYREYLHVCSFAGVIRQLVAYAFIHVI